MRAAIARRLVAAVLVVGCSASPAVAQEASPPHPQGHAQGDQPHGDHQPPQPADEHAGHGDPPHGQPVPPSALPPITDEDRAAAFPDLEGQHTVHDDAVHAFVLFDQLEWQTGDGLNGLRWDSQGWIGRDVNRFWFRSEGESEEDQLEAAEAHLLYGRAIARWWDLVVGVRQDFRPGPARTWAAVGIQGLAPYWFEVEATAYVGESGRTHLRLEAEYELLLTNRLVLQPLVELDIYGKADEERGLGSGLSELETGLRLRYEFRREFAPYVGVTWNRAFFGTADRARDAGEDVGGTRVVLGLRTWF